MPKKGVMMNKKGQGGMNAAVLVAIIAALIILYIIFLPTAEREKFVGGKDDDGANGEQPSSNILLKESPGTLSTSAGLEAEKPLPNIFLVETTNAKELEKINPFIVRSGWFDKKTHRIDFELDDPDNTDNVVLSFTAKKRQGVLTIKQNGIIIFENELASDIIEPVKLNKKLLGKSNFLEFSVSSVGARFWTTNEYNLENVKIIGDITDTSRQESSNLFTLSESEFSNLDKATLKFIPYCSDVNDIGTLEIFTNNKKLFASVPVCDSAYRQSIPKSALNEGENNIVFKTSRGSYSVEQVKVSLQFREAGARTYYFEVSKEFFDKIRDDSEDAVLTIKFADDVTQKRAKLDINGKAESIETKKAIFTKNINSKISEGNNFMRLEPLEDMEVVELKIEVI